MPDSRIDVEVLFREQGVSNIGRRFKEELNASTGEATRLQQAASNVRVPGLNDTVTLRNAISSVVEETGRLGESQAEVQRRFGEWAGSRFIGNTRVKLFDIESDLREQLSNAERMMARAQFSALPITVNSKTRKQLIEEQHQGLIRPTTAVEGSAQQSANFFEAELSRREAAEAAAQAKLEAAQARQAAAQEAIAARQEAKQAATQAKLTAAEEKESNRRIQIAEREAQKKQAELDKESETKQKTIQREAAASAKARMADYNSWLDQQQKLEKGTNEQVRRAEQILNRGVFSARPNEFPINTPSNLTRLPDASNWRTFFNRMETEQSLHDANQRGGFSRWISGINRQGALEGQAAVINTVQALASGMNPAHVAIMEGAQLGGAAVQGGLINLSTIFKAMVSTTGLLVGGIGAAIAATVAWSASIARANAAMANFQNVTALQGRDSVGARGDATERANRIRTSGFLGREESRETAIAIGSIPRISEETRGSLEKSAEALGRLKFGGDQEEANKFIRSTFSDPQKLKSFVDEDELFGDLDNEARKTFNAAVLIGDSFTAAAIAAKALEERAGPTIEIQQRSRESQGWLGRNMDLFGWRGQAEMARQSGSFSFTSLWQTPAFQPGTTAPHPEIQQGIKASERQLKVEHEINGLIEERKNILQAIERAAGRPIQEEFKRTLVESEERIASTHTPDEERDHAVKMANIESEIQKAQAAANHDISQSDRVAKAYQQKQQEITNYRTSEAAKRAGIAVQESEKEKQAAQEVENARRAQSQRSIDIQLQRSQLERAQIGPANLPAQREIIRRNIETLRTNKDSDESTRIGLESEDVNISRAIRVEAENTTIAQLRQGELILQEREDLASIVTLRRQEAAIIENSRDRTPTEKVSARTQILQSQIQAETQARHLQIQAIESVNQAEQRRLQTVSSFANYKVATGDISTVQAAQAEQQLSSQIVNEQARRITAVRDTAGVTRSERIRLNNELAQLYESDAQKQIDLQTRITQAIREENNRRTENFKNFFSAVESASADLLTAGLLKTQTKEQALKSFGSSIVTSFVKETESMASKFAGKGLASVLDVKLNEGEDTSISNVLAKAVGGMLGITSKEPKLDQAAISQRMQQAGDAQKQAGDLMLQAAREMKDAAGQGPYKGGKSPDLSTQVTTETQERAASSFSPRSGKVSDKDSGAVIASTLKERGWSDAAIQGALNNSITESSLNPNAIGAAKERGLFQLHPASHIKPFEAAYKGDWSAKAQTNYMADVVEKSMPGYPESTDARVATSEFLRGFEKPKDQSEKQVSYRFANNDASSTILRQASATSTPAIVEKIPAKIAALPDMEEYVPLDKPQKITASKKTQTPSKTQQAYREIEYEVTPEGEIISAKDVTSNEPVKVPKQIAAPSDTGDHTSTATGWSKDYYKTIGTPKGPRGEDYVFGAKIPRPEVDSSGNIVKYSTDPKQAEADRVVAKWKVETEQTQPAPIPQRTMSDLVTEATPRYKEITGGKDMMGDFRTAWGRPVAEYPTAMRLKEAYNDPQIKPLMQQADQAVKTAHPGFDVQSAFMSGKPSLDELLKLPVDGNKPTDTVKVEPSSVAQGVQKGQENVVSEFRSTIQEGTIQGQQAAVQATNQDVAQTQRSAESTTVNSDRLTESNSSIKELTQTIKEKGTGVSGGSAQGSLGGATGATQSTESALGGVGSAASTAQQGLSTFSSAAGLASSAALLFGKNLSPTGKAIVGGVGVLSNALSLGTKVASLFAAPATGGLSLAALAMEQGGVIPSALDGAVIPSAAGGMQIQEHSLPTSIKTGLRSMAMAGQVSPFASGRMIPSSPGRTAVNDGKGGRLIVGHANEMIIPAAETRVILDALNRPTVSAMDGVVIPSAEGGMVIDVPAGGSIDPRGIRLPGMLSSGVRDNIADNSTSITAPRNNVNNTTTLNYNANTTGYHPYRSRSDMEGMLRKHSDTILNHLGRAVKNGALPLRA